MPNRVSGNLGAFRCLHLHNFSFGAFQQTPTNPITLTYCWLMHHNRLAQNSQLRPCLWDGLRIRPRIPIRKLCFWLLDTWWHNWMETFSAWLALCEGNSPVTGEFPSQRPVMCSFDVFFDLCLIHDDIIKWKLFMHDWPFVKGIHQSLVNSPHKGQWHVTLMFSLICASTEGRVNNQEANDSTHHQPHYDVTVMSTAVRWLEA